MRVGRRHLAMGDYGLRLLTSVLLWGAGFMLLAGSTFALRMRDDVPPFVPGLSGPQGIAIVVAGLFAFFPLLWGSRYLRGLLVSAFIVTLLGAYWWTTIPWDELITKSQFPSDQPPDMLDYLRVSIPAILVAFYAATSRASAMRADYLTRGVDPREAARAGAASFLSGAAALVVAVAMAAALWLALANGLARRGLPVRGAPAVALAAGLLGLAYLLASGRAPLPRRRERAAPPDHARTAPADG